MDIETIDFIWLIRFLKMKSRIIAWSLAVSFVFLVVVSFLIPKKYTANTRILIKNENSVNLDGQSAVIAGIGPSLGIKNPNDVYLGICRSRRISDAIVGRYGLKEKFKCNTNDAARSKLNSSVDIAYLDGNIIEISVESTSPTLAASIADSYVDELRRTLAQLAQVSLSDRMRIIDEQIQNVKKHLTVAEIDSKEFMEVNGGFQVNLQASTLAQSMQVVSIELAKKNIELNVLKTSTSSDNPQRKQLEEVVKGLQLELGNFVNSRSDGALLPLKSLPRVGLEVNRKSRELERYGQLYSTLVRQYELAKIDRENLNRSIQVIDKAEIPEQASFPRKGNIIVAGMVCSFLVSIGVLLGLEFYRGKIGAGFHAVS